MNRWWRRLGGRRMMIVWAGLIICGVGIVLQRAIEWPAAAVLIAICVIAPLCYTAEDVARILSAVKWPEEE